jgi:putative ABC transport system permease protein
MTTVSQDLRYSLRMLLKHKAFTIVAALTLALGIGVNTAMFSVLNTFLFRSLPYPQSEQLVRVWRTSPHSQSWPHSAANFFDQHAQNTVFDKMAAYNYASRNLTEHGQTAERLVSIAATADFFPMLGVVPARGRVFKPEEFESGADNVIVLTDRLWARRFASDPNVVGRRIQLDGKTVEVVGVMPPGFEHTILWGPIDIWQPLTFTPERKTDRGPNYLSSFGRLKPGVTIQQAEQSMIALAANIGKQNSSNEGESIRLEPLQRSMSDSIGRTVMWFTFGLSAFVLLIACANLANLQLVRTAARARAGCTRRTWRRSLASAPPFANGEHPCRDHRRNSQSRYCARGRPIYQCSSLQRFAGRERTTRLQSFRLRIVVLTADRRAIRDSSCVAGFSRGCEPRPA